MLRGVNKQIIEINDTDNRFFEKAILYVRPDCLSLEETKLHGYAGEYLKNISAEKIPSAAKKKYSNKRLKKRALLLLGAAVIAAVVFALIKTVAA